MKRMLILRVTDDACDVEIDQIRSVAEMHGMTTKCHEIASIEDLEEAIKDETPFDYIYVAAHGNAQGFGDKELFIPWHHFSLIVCSEEVLAEGCVFLLACCRGGMNYVAFDIFAGCPLIEYVFGPRWTIEKQDITAGFHIFIYNMEHRRLQPDQAAERASTGTGYDFLCYDRVEVERTVEYQQRALEIDEEFEQIEQQDTRPLDAA